MTFAHLKDTVVGGGVILLTGAIMLLVGLPSLLDSESESAVAHHAAKGDAEAQFDIGIMYYTGTNLPQDTDKAIEFLTKAAEQGHMEAELALGCIFTDDSSYLNLDSSISWLEKASLQGSVHAQFRLSQIYGAVIYGEADGPYTDEKRALALLRLAAEGGYPLAQTMMGVAYDTGAGVAKDSNEAFRWFALAAAQGEPAAQCALGHLYGDSRNMWYDPAEAVRFYRYSADQGYSPAQRALAEMYESGQGVSPNPVAAASWFYLAAESGDAVAVESYKRIFKTLSDREKAVAVEFSNAFKKNM